MLKTKEKRKKAAWNKAYKRIFQMCVYRQYKNSKKGVKKRERKKTITK